MASLYETNGKRRIQFVDATKTRRTLYLGGFSRRECERILTFVERLLSAQASETSPDRETSAWLGKVSDKLADKLAGVGLAPKRIITHLGPFLDEYVKSRLDVKPATKVVWSHPIRNLKAFFGKDKRPEEIAHGDAEDFKQYLLNQKLSRTTVSKRIQFARMFFGELEKRDLIDKNPFADVSCTAVIKRERFYFVTREETARILDKCPDHNWRTIVALCRYGGLRCPSEILSLKWEHVIWDEKRIVVPSPKTEHHEGGDQRVIPLFPELVQYLDDSYHMAPEGAVYVISEMAYRRGSETPRGWQNTNLRTTFQKIITRAGLTPWPRLFHNLRASRETELLDAGYPIQCVTTWIGNSPQIAKKHYLMVTEEHYQRATDGTGFENPAPKQERKIQRTLCRTEEDSRNRQKEKTLFSPRSDTHSPLCENRVMETIGLEPTTPALQKQCSPN